MLGGLPRALLRRLLRIQQCERAARRAHRLDRRRAWRSRCRSACRCSSSRRWSPAISPRCSGFSPTALAALAAAGIMHFVWGRYCNYRATRAIGTNLVAPVQQFNLLVTLVLAIWLLGEYLTPLKIFGIALILLGPTFTMQKKKRRPKSAPSPTRRSRRSMPRSRRRSSRNMPRATRSRCSPRPAMG